MSLVYKSSVRENITDLQTYIVDTTPTSTKYFRVSDVPQVLQKGKNLLRITAHPTNLVPGSQVYVDVRDSNGNPIYYEIPDYLEEDKSRVISIWIYHDKGEDNTPNGEAIITLAGTANVDENGNVLPERHRGKINVKWQRVVTVDRNRSNTSEIIFKSDNLPNVIISQSVESYQNQPQNDNGLLQTTQTGKASYIKSGFSPIVQLTDATEFNSEMVGGSIILSNYTEVAQPQTSIENPLSSTFYSSSISEILNSTSAKVTTAYTTSFQNREDLIHTYTNISEADYKISYYQSGSNVSTENFRNFVTLTFNNVDPITGVVDKIKILQKSEGLSGDYELLNEVAVPFSSSLEVKVPIPSKNLNDPKILKLQYLNSVGSISRTETITTPFVFEGDNVYIGGNQNMISGSIFISNTLGSGIEIGGASSGFIRSVGYNGITSASNGDGPGGFVIYSGSGNLVFGEDSLDGVGVEFVGDNDDRHFIFTTANGGLLDVKTDKFFIGTTNTQFISGSDGNIEISSSLFHLDPANDLLVIGANAIINADLTVNNIRTPATIGGVQSTDLNASSSIKSDGFARFVSASVGGWDITTASIEGGNLIMQPQGILQTRDFVSGLKGWKISSEGNGTAEFENVRIRGTLRTTTFEKESVNAVGGQLWVANSTTITGSIGISDTTMSVKNASGFSAGEILLAKKVDSTGFQTEYLLLESASVEGDNSNEDETFGRIYVQRAYGSGTSGDFVGDLASAAQAYEDGQVIVSTGKLNTGYIKMNANPNDTATPYIDIVERTGSGLYDVALKARLGDLSGLSGTSLVLNKSNPGFGLATDNVYLQGGISATFGDIGGFGITQNAISSSNNNLILSSSGEITGSNVLFTGGRITGSNIDINVDTFFVGNPNSQYVSGSNGNLEISSSDFYLSADGSVVIGGNAQIDGDLIIGQVGSLPTNENLRIYLDFEEGDGTILFNKANPSEDFEILGSGYERVSGSNGIAVGNGLTLGGSAAVSASSGNHQIDIIHDGATSDYTQSINLWIKPNSLADGKQIIYEQGGSTSGQMIWMNNNVLYFSAWTNDAISPFQNYNTDTLTTALTDTSPVCVGVSMDYENMTISNPPTFKLYINGELNQTSSPTAGYAWAFGNNELGIGDVQGTSRIDMTVGSSGTSINATSNAGTYAFHGSVDEVRVYKQILTAAEFKGLYLNPAGIAAGTKISGDSIQTGNITSNNFSTTAGSQIDLNQGTIKLGGSSNPGFEVSSTGFVTATNFTEKVLTVVEGNSGSYFEDYQDGSPASDFTRLILDGSLGGSITMNMKLSVAPPYPIGDIKLPNQSDGSIQRADIIIDTTGIQFDEAQVATGADSAKQL